jgi:uncharacterized protein YegJ (DUF2314 family)
VSETHKFYGDDPELNAAIEEAQRRLPEFRRALDEDARRLIPALNGALVKARFDSPVTGAIEHMWIEDVGFEDDKIVGTLASEPNNIPELSQGAWVSVSPEDISDWVYRHGDRTVGGFTIRVMQQRGLEP